MIDLLQRELAILQRYLLSLTLRIRKEKAEKYTHLFQPSLVDHISAFPRLLANHNALQSFLRDGRPERVLESDDIVRYVWPNILDVGPHCRLSLLYRANQFTQLLFCKQQSRFK